LSAPRTADLARDTTLVIGHDALVLSRLGNCTSGGHVQSNVRNLAVSIVAVATLCGCESTRHDATSGSTSASQPPTVAASVQPPATVLVALGDLATFPTLRNLVSNSTLVARATVEELLPAVTFGDPPRSGWAATPTRLRVTDLIYGDPVSDGDPVVLQGGGTADGLTIEYEAETVFDTGTDLLVFAYPTREPFVDEQAKFLLHVSAEVGPDGRLMPGIWTEVAPSLQGMTITEIADAVRSL